MARFLSYADNDYYDKDYSVVQQFIDRESVLEFKESLIYAYCEMENISKEEALNRIKKEACKYYDLVKFIEDENTHDKALRILGRELFGVSYDYKKAKDKKKFLEKSREKYEQKMKKLEAMKKVHDENKKMEVNKA